MTTPAAPPERLGRFELRRALGSGAFGSVFEAYDPKHDATVALKRLERLDPGSLFRFKREFRTLARVVGPNIVRLHELFSEEPHVYFTMELVAGGDFSSHVRGELGSRARTADLSTVADASAGSTNTAPRAPASLGATIDWARLYRTTAELVRGMDQIHRAGFLHCDLKPSNVLVTPEGRVVLVDFGIAVDRKARALDEGLETAGTPAYMAPEQASGEPLPASDWYALGVMLFEVVSGRRPFAGNDRRVLREKLHAAAPRLSELVKDVPRELDELVAALLERDPALRPAPAEILARLGSSGAGSEAPAQSHAPFVGRAEPLARLEQAARTARTGHGRALLLSGESGIGKTTLLERFVERARAGGSLVLEGRCYENEVIAYNAFDGVVDALAAELVSFPEARRAELAQPATAALVRIFPVLARVPEIRGAELPHADILDRQELRRRAFSALRGLLASLAQQRGLLIVVDDVQWSDADGVALLAAIAAPLPDGTCLVLAHRSEDADSDTVRALEQALGADTEAIELSPLPDDEADRLLSDALGQASTPELARAVREEARGNPFLLEQLAHGVGLGIDQASAARFDRVLGRRLERLPEGAARLLELVSVASKPLDRGVLLAAAGIAGAPGLELVHALRAERLVRVAAAGQDALDVYHDRVRQALSATLAPAARRAHHRALADTLTARGSSDHEALYFHEKHAGNAEAAARHAETAAAAAARALAFDRAARLYREAIALGEPARAKRRELEERLADALVYSGRGVDAADVYLKLAERSQGIARLDLERRATEQLLVCGAVARALSIAVVVLAAVGLGLARVRLWAVVETLLLRIRIRLRGLHWTVRSENELEPLDLIRIDICETLAGGLGFNDTLRGAPFSARYILLSLKAGEPRRLARALALDGGYSAALGHQERARVLHEHGRRVAQSSGRPDALAPVIGMQAFAATLRGDFFDALELYDESFRLYHEEGGMSSTTSHFEISMLRQYQLNSYYHLGELRVLERELPEALAAAKDRGNIGFGTSLRLADTSMLWLIQDRPEELRREASDALSQWPERPFTLIQLFALLTFASLDLYEGNPERAARRFDESWSSLVRSLLLRVRRTRALVLLGRGRAAVAAAAAGIRPEHQLRLARRTLRRLRSMNEPWVVALTSLLEAGVQSAAGDPSGARDSLERAERELSAQRLALYHALTCRALAAHSDGERAEELHERANDYFRAQGVVRPERVMRVIAPPFG